MTNKTISFLTIFLFLGAAACDQTIVEHGDLSGYPGHSDNTEDSDEEEYQGESGEGWGETGAEDESTEEGTEGSSEDDGIETGTGEGTEAESTEEGAEDESTEEDAEDESTEENAEDESTEEGTEEESSTLPEPEIPCGEIEGLNHRACPPGYVCETLNIGCVPYEPPDHPCFVDLQTAHDIRKANGVTGACILQDGKTCKEHLAHSWIEQTCPGNFFKGTCLEASMDDDPLWNWNLSDYRHSRWIGSCVDSNLCESNGEIYGVVKHGIHDGAADACYGYNFFPSPELCSEGALFPNCQ